MSTTKNTTCLLNRPELQEFLTQEALRAHFDYAPNTGILYPKGSDEAAGYYDERLGRVRIGYAGKLFLRSHLVWAYFGNTLEEGKDIDHSNRIPLDDRIENLQEATKVENAHNKEGHSIAGLKGVTKRKTKHGLRYDSRIVYKGEEIFLGRFKCSVKAAIARDEKAYELVGEFAYLNFPHMIHSYRTKARKSLKSKKAA